ncbi:MAG TPA: hypothetical protein VK116_10790, partial [Planctomycetota bacterium]|nr:hypothetical protein [Planctomycetota bacterium]
MSSYLYTAIGALGLGAAVVLGVVSMAEKSVAEPDAALLSSKERIASLERRIAELEAELAARAEPSVSPAALRGRAATVSGDVGDELAVASSDEESPALDDGDPHRLPTIEELFALVDRRDAEGLSAAVRKLLEAGDPDGFEVLSAFLGAEARSPRQALFGAGPLVASLFRVAFENDTATAAFADWVLDRADDSEPALLAKLRRVLPAFLSGRDGRFGDLHGRFVAHLDAIFATEDDTRWEALAAYTELRVPAPPEIISTLVSSPGDQNRYREILAHIAAVGHEAGIDALIAYLDGVESLDHWAVP